MSVNLKFAESNKKEYQVIPEMGVFKYKGSLYIKVRENVGGFVDICIDDNILESCGDTDDDVEVVYLGQAKITIELE